MSPTTQNDQELSCALERAIEMCRKRITQALERRNQAQTRYEVYLARLEYEEWDLALTNLTLAELLRKR